MENVHEPKLKKVINGKKDKKMPLPILAAIPAAIIGAAVVYVKAHALTISFVAAKAAAMALMRGGSADDARRAAMSRGAVEAAADLVVDFLKLKL